MSLTPTQAKEQILADFSTVAGHLREVFDRNIKKHSDVAFYTNTKGLSTTYLQAFSEEHRQGHNCNCCLDFLRAYGGLVGISKTGVVTSLLWEPENAPEGFADAFAALRDDVLKRRISGVYTGPKGDWGRFEAGGWNHMAVKAPEILQHVAPEGLRNESREHYKYLNILLAENEVAVINNAIKAIKAPGMNTPERFLPQLEWLRDLKLAVTEAKDRSLQEALKWNAVGYVSDAWLKMRSSVAGNLLENVRQGVSFPEIKRRHNESTHVRTYQRAQAAPAAGNVQSAEKLIAELGIRTAFQRRFARFEEVVQHTIWTPPPVVEKPAETTGGLFDHLVTKESSTAVKELETPDHVMTWDVFQRTVLPTAQKIEVYVNPYPNAYGSFTAPVDPEAGVLYRWDSAERRNAFGWFTHVNGVPGSHYGFPSNAWLNLRGILPTANQWFNETRFKSDGENMFFVLEGGKAPQQPGLAIFPPHMRSELHGIRSTIEAFSNGGSLEGREEADVFGFFLLTNGGQKPRLRVTTDVGSQVYAIDRLV